MVFELRSEHIWHAFSYLAILEHCESDGRPPLQVPSDEDQKDRLSQAIEDRNKHFERFGQPEWGHYCHKCVHFFRDENGKITRELLFLCSFH
jgi:hypothetical protein